MPTTGDILRAVKERWDEDGIPAVLEGERPDGAVSPENFPAIQRGEEAQKGTPFPYVVIDATEGIPVGGSSNKTQNGKQIRHQLFDNPMQFRVHAKIDDDAERLGKLLGRSLERADLNICGSQKFVTLFRASMPTALREGDENYSFTVRYTVRTDAETAL